MLDPELYPVITTAGSSLAMKKQILVYVCLLVSEVLGQAQTSSTCRLSGQVVAHQKTDLSVFRVEAYDLSQHSHVASATLTMDGSFSLPALPVERYRIDVVNTRNEPIAESIVEVTPACPSVTLALPDGPSQKPASGAVSISHLSHRVPKEALKEFRRSQKAADDGDMAANFEHLQKALDADPEFVEAYLNLGAAYMARNEPRQASEQFSRALKLDPSSVMAWTNMAITQLHLGQSTQAEDAARRALRLDPTSIQAHYALALSWVVEGRFDQPILDELQPTYSKFPRAHMIAAEALAGVGKIIEARAEVELYMKSANGSDRARAERYLRQLAGL